MPRQLRRVLLRRTITLYALAAALTVGGCATTSTLPEAKYEQFSRFAGWTQKCFENNFISPQMYAETKNALAYTLGTWNYDTGKMQSMIRSAYTSATPNAGGCRQTEANAYQLIAAVNQNRSDRKESQRSLNESVQEFNRSMSTNKPVYCNRIGTMTMCN